MPNLRLPDVVAELAKVNARWSARPNAVLAMQSIGRARLLGVTVDKADLAAIMAKPPIVAAGATPTKFDWRNNGGNFISPVKNQLGCGSCVSFGSVAALEAMARIKKDVVLDASEADLHFCSSHGENCSGWWPSSALDSLKNRGVTSEDRFPYASAFGSQGPKCLLASDRDLHATKISEQVPINSTSARKSWIATNGPVVGVFHVYDDFFTYGTGVYHHVTGGDAGYHAVLIVGYDDVEKCWICKNSWGSGWGDKGFFKIGYGECGIDETSKEANKFPAWGIKDVKLATPNGQFLLQTGTALHETDSTFSFLLAQNLDLFAIKKSNTGSKSTEVHVLSAKDGYQRFSLQTATALHETDATFSFCLAPNRDLYAIKKSNTGTGSTELHVLSAQSGYQSFTLQTGTGLHETDSSFDFCLAENLDLIAVKKSNTGTKTTEVHVLSAVSGYQDFVLQTPTALHETDATYEFEVGRNRDLIAITKSGTATKSTEVQVLSAASGYSQFTKQTGTVLHETDSTWEFGFTPARELFGVKKSNTGSASTEIHKIQLP